MGSRTRVSPGHEELLGRLGLEDPRAAPTFRSGELIKDTGSSRLLRITDAVDGGVYYLKTYAYPHWRPAITYAWRRCRADREYSSLVHLRSHGIPAPEPIAWGVARRCRILRSCFVLTRAVEGATNLDRLLGFGEGWPADVDRRSAFRSGFLTLAHWVRRTHATGLFDPNLHLRNILVTWKDQTPEFWFIDHPKATTIGPRCSRRRHRGVRRDLAVLDRSASRWVGVKARLLFLRAYLQVPNLAREHRGVQQRIARLSASRSSGAHPEGAAPGW